MFSNFEYYRPQSLSELWEASRAGAQASYIAGGTDLLVKIKNRLETPETLISLRSIPELRGVKWGSSCVVGAGVTIGEILADRQINLYYPVLVDAARVLGSLQIRNTATIGGNLCNASPAADMAPPLLVLEAEVVLQSPNKLRRIPLKDFFVGPSQTRLKEGEIMSAVEIPLPFAGYRAAYLRKGRVKMDLAKAGLAVLTEKEGQKLKKIRIAAGAVAPTPLRLVETEAVMEGEILTEKLMEKGQAMAKKEISPINDQRSTEDYRRDLISALLKEALQNL